MVATATLFGIDPWRLITIRDQTEWSVMEAIVNRAVELLEQRDQNLATDIANKLSKVLK
jgi:hypothetical protein